MRKIIKKLFVSIALVLIIGPAPYPCGTGSNVFAEDVDLEKIVVTASRREENRSGVARNIDVVTEKNIEETHAKDLTQVLTDLTSVNISDYGGSGGTKTIRMRGSTASQVLVLVNGRPINNPRDGQADLNSIPLDDIARVEVLHGPGSSLYGTGAMGGTVNVITKDIPKEKQKTELYSSFGSFRTYTERFSHGARVSKFGYLISSEYKSSGGFRDNSELDSKDINTKLEYELNENNTLVLNSGFYRSKAGSPGKIDAPDLDDKQINLKNFLDLNWKIKPTEEGELSTKIYENYDRLEYNNNAPEYTTDIHTTKVRGMDLQYAREFSDVYQLICGFNYVDNLNNSTTSAKHKYTVRAVFLENQLDLFKDFKLNFGARADDYSNFGTEINPSAGFMYKIGEDSKLRGLISRSFRAPTFNDLYFPSKDYSWGSVTGNPNLKPEKGITKELGIETRMNKYLLTSVTYYRNDYRDLINWIDENSVYQPKNINSAVIDGIEFDNKLELTNNWEFDAGYTFLRAKDTDTRKYLVYQPKHKIDFSLKCKELNNFTCELKGQFTDKRFYDAENTINVKRFFVLGFNVTKKLKPGVTCFASIDNLLNKKYQVIKDYPMPGFSLTSGLKMEF